MQPVNQRQGFLVSVILHLTIFMMLLSYRQASKPPVEDPTQYDRKATVFMPPRSVVRQMAPRPVPRPPSASVPAPLPTPPPPPSAKDRISVGSAFDRQTKGPILLQDRMDEKPKGVPSPAQTAPPPQPTPPPSTPTGPQAADAGGVRSVPGSPGFRTPSGLGRDFPRGDEGIVGRPGPLGSSVAQAIRQAERQLDRDAQLGLPTGTRNNLSGLHFDPQGADFSAWLSYFKGELYRNWIAPQPALMGMKAIVSIEFVVERDGTISGLRVLQATSLPAFTRSAQNALSSSHLLPLPSDYRPPRVVMILNFYYNYSEIPEGS